MHPEKLMAVDKRFVTGLRVVTVLVSIAIATLCALVYKAVIVPSETMYNWASLPVGMLILAIGFIFSVWNPYTITKVRIQLYSFAVTGGLISGLLMGFSNFTFACWILLLAATSIYLRLSGVLIVYGIMVASLITWSYTQRNVYEPAQFVDFGLTALVIAGICAVLLLIWRLTRLSVQDVETSHHRADYRHSQLISLVNSMADGVVAIDGQGIISLYNAAALDILDSNRSMQDQSIADFFRPMTKDNATIDVLNFIQTTQTATVNRDLKIKYADGSFASLY